MNSYVLASHSHLLCVLLELREFDVLDADMRSMGDLSEAEDP
jgi:hypothetical protein